MNLTPLRCGTAVVISESAKMVASVCASEDEVERDRITAIVRVAVAEAGFQDLKLEQMQAILEFISDICVSLLTGYGISLIYGLLPPFAVAYRSSSSPSQSWTLYRHACAIWFNT